MWAKRTRAQNPLVLCFDPGSTFQSCATLDKLLSLSGCSWLLGRWGKSSLCLRFMVGLLETLCRGYLIKHSAL